MKIKKNKVVITDDEQNMIRCPLCYGSGEETYSCVCDCHKYDDKFCSKCDSTGEVVESCVLCAGSGMANKDDMID